jgi:3',5'-cyclic AMP phosphodiesterase CpdA
MALEVDDLIIGGDLCDFDSLSAHPADLPQTDLNQSIEVTGQVLRYLKSAFRTIYLLPGNHDRRLAKKLDKHLSFTYLVKMFVGDTPGFVATDADFYLIDSEYAGRAGWSVGHPRFFSSYPTKGLDQVALQRQRHVIGAHSHTLGASKIGPYWCISPGHMMRPDLTPYLTRSAGLSKHADQSAGFVLVEHEPAADVVTLFADGLTRWRDYV